MKNTACRKTAKRIAAFVVALCLAAAVCPAAFAATNYSVWVNGTRLTSSNAGSFLGGTVSYDNSKNTLTLNGANLTKGTSVQDSGASAAIYSSSGLNVVLKGNNKISGTGYAIVANGALNISGSGSLTSTTSGDMLPAYYSGKTMKLSGCSVTATASGNDGAGILAGAVEMENATVSLTVKGAAGQGIFSYDDVKLTGTSLSTSVSGDAAVGIMVSDGNLDISGGSAVSATVSGKESFGIFASEKVNVAASRLTADTSGKNSTGIGAAKVWLESGSLTATGTEAAAFVEGGTVGHADGSFTVREGDSAPGSVVSSLTNKGDSGAFSSCKYIQMSNGAEVVRFGGATRYETAVLISKNWGKADNVVLACGSEFADALAGVPLAKALDAPIILTETKKIADSTMKQIAALGAKNIYILGGEAAISAAAEKQLTDAKYKVERVAGSDRFATSVAVAAKLAKITGKTPTSVYLAYGRNYPDALAISSAAAIQGYPVLYAPATGKLNDVISDYISSNGVKNAVVLGGESAVGKDVFNDIKNYCSSVERISGADRYETASNIITKYASVFTGNSVAIATGTNYPDALAGAAYAAKQGIAVVLAPATLKAGSDQTKMLKKLVPAKAESVCVFGGTSVVPESVVLQLIG